MTFSARADVLTRRTYSRPLGDGLYESWGDTTQRVIAHQRWLWERAQGGALLESQNEELGLLYHLIFNRRALPSGRTLWLGGTEIAKRREASQFNCAAERIETVHDSVDLFWLLLQGCGVGFEPVPGLLNGFAKPIPEIQVVRSDRADKGEPNNIELWDPDSRTWGIKIGDSAEAWSKSVGKLLAGKHPADKLVIDYSEIRPAGSILSGYGWECSGDINIHRAFDAICALLNRRAGQLLSHIDILDVCNWLGTTLSSRRSAEIALYPYGAPGWEAFAAAKYEEDPENPKHWWRGQSNNSLLLRERPSRAEIDRLLEMMVAFGGSEPGLVNVAEAKRRAPWFSGLNPCGEITLPNKGFCNLSDLNVAAFDDFSSMRRAIYLLARANYRQTCVNLDDGILQRAWHENQQFFRLCGVGLTGLVRRPDLTDHDLRTLRNVAVQGAYGMAAELGLPRPKNVTTIKPSGTLSKIMDTTEGVHTPPGRYLFNKVQFAATSPLVERLRDAGYRVQPHPYDATGVLVTFPVHYPDVAFAQNRDGVHVNLEPAVDQLHRYRRLMRSYVDQNVSITVSYDKDEVPAIAAWMDRHWDDVVAVSFLPRNDPTKTAADLGYAYLPQQVVAEAEYGAYAAKLKPVDLGRHGMTGPVDDECQGGACPVR